MMTPSFNLTGARHHADGEQQRIAGENESDQQASFGEHDGGESGIAEPAGKHGGKKMNQAVWRSQLRTKSSSECSIPGG